MSYWRLGETGGSEGKDLGWNGETLYYSGVGFGKPGALSGTPDTSVQISSASQLHLPYALLPRAGTWATVETWVKTTGTGAVLNAENEWGTQQHPVLRVLANGRLSAAFQPTSTPITTGSPVNDNAWHHVVLTVAKDVQTLYVDGQQVGTLNGTVGDPMEWPELKAGGIAAFLDEMAVYDRPLSAGEVAGHYAARAESPYKLAQITLPSGRVWAANVYDAVTDRVKTHTDEHGGTWQIGEPAYNRTTGMSTVTVTDPHQGTLKYVHDAWRGYRLMSRTDQLGKKTTYSYDTGGFLFSTVDANNNVVETHNDARGNVIQRRTCRTSSSCQWSRYSYHLNAADPFDARNDLLLASWDPRTTSTDKARATSWEYSSYGEETKQTAPLTPDFPAGWSVSTAYTDGTEPAVGGGFTPAGLVKTRTDARGNVWTQKYTTAGDLAEQIEPEGMRTVYEYDSIGRPTARVEYSDAFPDGVRSTFTYDGLGRLRTHTGAPVQNEITGKTHTSQTRYTYDPDGNKLTDTVVDLTGGDPERTITYTYDTRGRTETVTGPEGGVIRYTWDQVGAKVEVTDELGSVFGYTYTKRGELASRTLKNWTGSPVNPQPAREIVLASYSYDPVGRLASRVDAMERKTSFTYYNDDLPHQVIGTGVKLNGSSTTRDVVLEELTYDAAGNPATLTTPGAQTAYVYDAANRLTSSTFDTARLARKIANVYDANGNVTKQTLTAAGTSRAESVEYSYNKENQLVRRTVENGDDDLTTTWAVNDRGLVTATTEPRGNVAGGDPERFTTSDRHDAAGRLVERKLPEIQVERAGTTGTDRLRPTTRYGHDSAGQRSHVMDAEGRLSTTTFDRAGRVTAVIDPAYTPPGGTQIIPKETYGYDAAGRLMRVTDRSGQLSTMEYDALGNQVRVTDPAVNGALPGQWTSEFNRVGEPLAEVDPNGARSEATYDDLGRMITRTEIERHPSAAAYTTKLTYTDAGFLEKLAPPVGQPTLFTRNAAGEVTQLTDPMGNKTVTTYDLAGRVTKTTTPLGYASLAEYDLAGQLTALKDLGTDGRVIRSTAYGYDAASNLTSTTSGEGRVTERSFDETGRLVELKEPVSANESITTSFGYDAVGDRTRTTDGRGNTVWTTYNSLRLVESLIEPSTAAHPDLADRTWLHTYDAEGNLTSLAEPGGVRIDRQFDELGRLSKETGHGASVATPERTYRYDAAGRQIVIGDYGLEYNDRDLLTRVTRNSAQMAAFTYDALGNPMTRSDTSGNTSFTWDDNERLKTATDPVTGRAFSYGYDSDDRLTSLNSSNPANSQTFTYDALDRLETHTLKSSSGAQLAKIAYGWDKDDNLTSKSTTGTAGAGANTYGYDHVGRLTSWTAPDGTVTAYTWDAAGNRTGAGDKSYAYDQRNRLVSGDGTDYSYTARGTLATTSTGGVTTNMTFDAFDRLVAEGDVIYTYDALDRLVSRRKGAEETTFAYSGLENDIVTVADGSGTVTARYGRDPNGRVLSMKEGASPALGVMTDYHADVVATYTGTSLADSVAYNPFGEPIARTGSRRSLGYQSEYTDPDTGKVNMHARWYQPGTGGFASRDDWTLEPEPSTRANRYSYADGAPLGNGDPSGHAPDCCGAGGGGGGIGSYNAKNWKPVWRAVEAIDAASDLAGPAGWAKGAAKRAIKAGFKKVFKGGGKKSASQGGKKALDRDNANRLQREKGNKRYLYAPKKKPKSKKQSDGKRGPKTAVKVPKKPKTKPTTGKKPEEKPKKNPVGSKGKDKKKPTIKSPKDRKPTPRDERAGRQGQKDKGCRTGPCTGSDRDGPEAGYYNVGTGHDEGYSPAYREIVEEATETTTESIVEDIIDDVAPDLPSDPLPDEGLDSCLPNSFVPGTPVLMADGSRKVIEDVKVGDHVLAADPGTGRMEAQPVTALISSHGRKHLVRITVDLDGDRGTAADVVEATAEHPFWLPALKEWVPAGQLEAGAWLRTSAGTYVQISAIQHRTATQRVHNLTIDDFHTYYVVAGDQAILVHNSGPGGRERGPDGRFLPNSNPLDPDSRYDRVSLWEKTKRAIQGAAPTDANGDFIDPNTGQIIPKGGPFHYGHKPGHEYWRARDLAREKGLSREEFIASQNNPDHYQIEDPYNNMSHQYESHC
ncbi:GH-E family nuclease [Nonomuraea sp. MCN248]|uniref:GH-E family nuclease n=1 Tax=Nonomuraea corallina TaxID=2989783 RepID=A0ABT4S6F3_9ACTN|nr:GH-E family nuclease [Nonomuraea corallina]MDA0632516.1 GH-E family nuclease [Nonomuraea corallina]